MNIKLIGLCLVVSALLVVGSIKTFSRSQQQLSADQVAELEKKEAAGLTTRAEQVQLAKAKGLKRIVAHGAIFCTYIGVKDLDEALAGYRVVIAEPINVIGSMDYRESISSWYKFRVLETLSRGKPRTCPTCSSAVEPPSELLPLKDDEVLVPKQGGSVTIDGVELVLHEADFPAYRLHQKYLLFLSMDESGRVGSTAGGPVGALRIKPDGDSVESINGDKYILQGQIEERHGNSIARLREYLENHLNTQ